MEPNKTGVSEQVFLEVLHSEYRRIDSEYREKAVASFFFAPFSDQLPVSWAIDSLSMTWKRMFEDVPPTSIDTSGIGNIGRNHVCWC